MATAAPADWKAQFGLDDRQPPHFFSRIDQLDTAPGNAPQPHALRRAFEQLEIDGVLCQERRPVIYFRQVRKVDPGKILKLHRSFWNQGIAPILVIIAPDEVHVYSGLIPPEDTLTDGGQAPGLVETLVRVQEQLRSFLLSVESGEYFRKKRAYFNPRKRVDRDLLRNLRATRQELGEVQAVRLEPQTLDALLCRLVFTCYLCDRGIIDQAYLKSHHIHDAGHLKDILAKKPRTDAKADLYQLFEQLGNDFNGDLFNADLRAESRQVRVEHLEILDRFFHGDDARSGQQSFWPYDFEFIPIETISAIYEHFLKAAGEEQKKEAGAFYTPRFLAEFVLDVALENETSLLDKRFLDPACGSGIFLVGLFNRLAEEWKWKNPGARYDRRANGLMDVLRNNLYGIDCNRSACQITAFSLYLAFLDQLSPPDIEKLLGKWERLPPLVFDPDQPNPDSSGTIRRGDFFTDVAASLQQVDVIVGNPPWGPVKKRAPLTAAEIWCGDPERRYVVPNREKAVPFVWKASIHLKEGGKVCFVLPHGILFNHKRPAIRFQQTLFRCHAVDTVVNLCDLQRFLFEESEAPALVVRYHKDKAAKGASTIDYWTPKADWAVTQAELLSIRPQDRSRLTVREVLDDLTGDDAPLVWKLRSWATPRDWQLLDRLSIMKRLREIAGRPNRGDTKRWIIAQGFEQRREGTADTKTLLLPTDLVVEARSRGLQLFLLKEDCARLPSREITVRQESNTNTIVYTCPHVLVMHGFSRIAYADFDVSFRHAVRGIHGPADDRELLIFLAAYLRSDLASYFLFHTSSNWGVSRAKIHGEELLRLPFPLPDDTNDPKRARLIVRKVATAVTRASHEASGEFADREGIVLRTQESIRELIYEYFGVDDVDRMLIADTAKIIIPSVRPSRARPNVPTVKRSSPGLRASYAELLCGRLNSWAKLEYRVHARPVVDVTTGVGMVVLEKTKRGETHVAHLPTDGEVLKTVDRLQHTLAKTHGLFELVRGLKVFHRNRLYITKPLGQRFWTSTAALNDADEIAATILTRSAREEA